MQTIRPAKTQIFAKEANKTTKTKSGILLTEDAAEKPLIAEVINVGSKVDWVQQHDQIIYKPYATTEFKLNDEEYILIDEADVLGVVAEVAE